MPASKLSKCLITPSRLTSVLRWKEQSSRGGGSIMALQISRARIALALMKHSQKEVQQLNPIKLEANKPFIRNRKNDNKENIVKQLLDIAKTENVCGLVVGWPLEPSGCPGSRCGKVLHLLDHFAESRQEGGYLINPHSRPVVLFDERKITHGQFDEHLFQMDEWGRCQVFGKKFPLPCEDEFGHEIEHSFKTSLRSDHPTSGDSTAATLLLGHFMNDQSIMNSRRLTQKMETGNRSTKRKAENMDHSHLEQIIESFEGNENHTVKILPL